MWPKECGFKYQDSFQFVDDTIGVNQSDITADYIIRYRILESDIMYNYYPEVSGNVQGRYIAPPPYGHTSSNPAYQWYTYSFSITEETDVENNVITVPVANILATNPCGGTAEQMATAWSGKNLQWCWGKVSSDSVSVTGTAEGFVMNVSSVALNTLQNYQLVQYTDVNNIVSYGYVCKYNTTTTIANTIVLYKYIDGAINMAELNTTNCVQMTGTSGTVSSYLLSNWVNCYFYMQQSGVYLATSTFHLPYWFAYTTVANVKQTFNTSQVTINYGGSYPYDYVTFYIYDSTGENLLYETDHIYTQNLSFEYDGMNPNYTYMLETIVTLKDCNTSTGKTAFTTNINFAYTATYPIALEYNSCEDYVIVRFPRWNDYNTDTQQELYVRDTTAGDILYKVIWNYKAQSDETNNVIKYYNVKNGHTYEFYLFGIDADGNQYQQEVGTADILFNGYFLDDVEHETSYQFATTLSGGDESTTNNISEIKQSLQYNANMIGKTEFANGTLTAQLVSNTAIDNNYLMSQFKEFVSSNRKTYYKTPNGKCYDVFITDTSLSLLLSEIASSPINVSFSWHQISND